MHLRNISEKEFTCNVNVFTVKFGIYKIFLDKNVFLQNVLRTNFVFYKNLETKLCFSNKCLIQTLYLRKISGKDFACNVNEFTIKFVFTTYFETNLCFYKTNREQILFFLQTLETKHCFFTKMFKPNFAFKKYLRKRLYRQRKWV